MNNAAPTKLAARLGALAGVNGAMLRESLSHTLSHTRRSKCTYCIGCCSITLVVTVAAVVYTLIAAAPLIFLREAESAAGQLDLRLTSSETAETGGGYLQTQTQYLNYTQIAAALAKGPDAETYSYHTPRHVMWGTQAWGLSGAAAASGACNLPPGADSLALLTETTNAWMYARPGAAVAALSAVGEPVPAPGTALSTEVPTRRPLQPDFMPSACGARSCIIEHCYAAPAVDLSLMLIDTAREQRMQLGRAWELGPIPAGQVVLHAQTAEKLRVAAGDVVMFRLRSPYLVRHAFAPENSTRVGWADLAMTFYEVALPMRVWRVVSTLAGKLPLGDNMVAVAEYAAFIPYAAPRLNPRLTTILFPMAPTVTSVIPVPLAAAVPLALRQALEGTSAGQLYHFAQEVLFNLPPRERIPSYQSPNYDRVRAAVADFASNMLYVAGFTESTAELSLLTALESRRFITLYLGLVLDVLLIILFALSVILVYSLLLVNAEERTFEMAVRRMIGSQRSGIVLLLLTQAFAYGFPAWIAGLVASQILTAILLRGFTNISSIPVSQRLTPPAILTATALALAIPAVSAIGPIRSALKRTIREALDSDRPKATAVEFKLERSSDGRISRSLVVVGIFMSVFGFGIYYLLPLALLSLNLSLFFNLFLAIIVGMLAGLILLSLNIELLLLRVAAALTAQWWEASAVFSLLWSNVSAGHRKRNRKTTLMYALSIAFIVFVAVAAETQVQSASYAAQARQGAPLTIGFESPQEPPDPAALAAVEAVVRSAKWVGGTAWASARMDTSLGHITGAGVAESSSDSSTAPRSFRVSEAVLRSRGRLGKLPVGTRAVGPQFLGGATYNKFITPESAEPVTATSLSLSEQLYTARGSSGVILSNSMYWDLWITRGQDSILQTSGATGGTDGGMAFGSARYSRTRVATTALLSGGPGFIFARGPSTLADTILTSVPQYARLLDAHATTVGIQRVSVQHTVPRVWGDQLLSAIAAAMAAPGVRAGEPSALAALQAVQQHPIIAAINETTTPSAVLAAARAADVSFSPIAARGCMSDSALQRACLLLPLVVDALRFPVETSAAASALDRMASAVGFAGLGASSNGAELPPSLRSVATAVSIEDLPLGYMYVGFDDEAVSSNDRNALKTAVTTVLQTVRDARFNDNVAGRGALSTRAGAGEWTQADMAGVGDDLAVTINLLQLFFAVLALVAMILCFFSLLASMVTNIHEQRKEIAILRALGLPNYALIRIYVHEAALLVLTSSLTGTIIGCVVAWTFGAQQSLFTSLPLPFAVPWGIIVVVVLVSLVASIFAAGLPARALTKVGITQLLRGI